MIDLIQYELAGCGTNLVSEQFVPRYMASVPHFCNYQTQEEHHSIMLCWGLCLAVCNGYKMDCEGCMERKDYTE